MPNTMHPFFSYYGAKWRSFNFYPAPQHDTIVEPFAGAAGYATRYYKRNVILCEKSETLAALWHYLINVSPAEIMALPILVQGERVDEYPELCEEAASLIGFWINKAFSVPGRVAPGPDWNSWTPRKRGLIAHQVQLIRHWEIHEGDYTDLVDRTATWFIDPPYQDPQQGDHYPHGREGMDYTELATYCRTRTGQVIVCEGSTADWLPFRYLVTAQASGRGARVAKDIQAKHAFDEAIWTNQWEDLPWIEQETAAQA